MPSARPRTRDVNAGLTHAVSGLTTSLAVARAAVKVSRLSRGEDLAEIVAALRSEKRSGTGWTADPALAPRIVERLLFALPPYRLGRCVKRSLLLVALWSQAGLETVLHLGFRAVAGGRREGHAWVTTNDTRFGCVRPAEVVEALEL